MAMLGVENVFRLLDAVLEADSDEECLGLILARIARENDNLADCADLEDAKIFQIRIKSLKTMAEIVEQRVKIRNSTAIDPQLASEKILKFLTDKIVMSFEEMNMSLDQRNTFIKYLQYHLEEWETVKKTILADA